MSPRTRIFLVIAILIALSPIPLELLGRAIRSRSIPQPIPTASALIIAQQVEVANRTGEATPLPAASALPKQTAGPVTTTAQPLLPSQVQPERTAVPTCQPATLTTTPVDSSAKERSQGIHSKDFIQYYELPGTSLNDIAAARDSCGIRLEDGWYTGQTITNWWYWTWYATTADGKCTLDTYTVTVHNDYLYPRFRDYAQADAFTRASLDFFATALAQHERGHAQILADQLADFTKAITKLAPTDTCSQLDATIGSMAAQLNSENALSNQIYDRETKHGATQGARLP